MNEPVSRSQQQTLDLILDRMEEVSTTQKEMDTRIRKIEKTIDRSEGREEIQSYPDLIARIAALEKTEHVFSGKWAIIWGIAVALLTLLANWGISHIQIGSGP